MTIDDVDTLFRNLGLQRPSNFFTPFGHWSGEGLPLETPKEERARKKREAANPRRKCTCCDCYLTVGPPGCNGKGCRSCGGEH